MLNTILKSLHAVGYAATAAIVMAIAFYLASDDLQGAMLAAFCAAVAGGFLGWKTK